MTENAPSPTPPLDQLPCGVLVADEADQVVWINETLAAWLARRLDAANPTHLHDWLHPDCHTQTAHWTATIDRTGNIADVLMALSHAEGHGQPMLMSARRRATPAGHCTDYVFLPAADRQMNERELAESREEMRLLVHEATRQEADAQDRALFAEQMVGIVSHDLRNPLAAVHMGILALTRGDLTANQIRVLGRVSRATERAHRLIADLLDFTAARIGAGLAVAPRAVALNDVIADTVEELALARPERELVHVRGQEGVCPIDPDRLSQLVGNLVSNALTYGDPTRPVTVSSSVDDGCGLVSVHNWGDPIPAESVGQLFQPMVRGGRVGEARSVGLGLYIVGEIAKAHGGRIEVRSDAGHGTVFEARFPAG
ncbi:HAMP domain-containing sensor histidine kinase [Xylophilus sp. GOD-11R]|uniref:sensor histidine kinase n=1 Tax=Xylophilus sp. GOD-11R TaxID=3089814 RepID=UPI00298C6CA6|nr:HAMP domain-containing sensor histidine kinase [Xylophilus sp. GOD-11R]WPB58105.1 HAMP domain-containing sensor histidine kinase [Xylophilus sp. GOD-11R]